MDTIGLQYGESGGAPATPQELDERLRIVEERVRRDAREIVEVLRVDFPKFIERAVKDRFVSSGGYADSLGDSELKSIKADTERTGKRAAEEIVPPLEEWGIWLELSGPIPPGPERRDLRANAEVHARIQRIGGYARDVLARHKFPNLREEEFNEAYRLPQWFIAGRHLVTLVENYWRDMDEYHGLRDALRGLKDRDQKSKRADRWDAV